MNIILDWSGTIADDHKLSWQLTNKTLEHFGNHSISYTRYQNDFNIPITGFYQKYCPGISPIDIDKVYFEFYRQSATNIALFKGIPDILKNISIHHSLFILSTLNAEVLEQITVNFGLRRYFKEIQGNAFEKADSLASMITKHALIKSETLFIGDMPHDIESAKRNKIAAGAVTYGYSSQKHLAPYRPDYFFKNALAIQQHTERFTQTENRQWPLVTVGGLVFNSNHQALLIKTQKWSGLFGTPGGKVDYGETLEQAFCREIKEETNLDIRNIKYVFFQDCIEHPQFYKPAHFLLMNFIAKCDQFEVILNYESEDYCWASLEEMDEIPLNEPTLKLTDELKMRKEFFLEWIK